MTIIAVDDEELALEGMLRSIREAAPDAEVNGFLYTEDALEFASRNHCDIAFLDVEMPEVNGIALAEQLKQFNPAVNIIFATGYAHYRDAAFDLHASGYLTKPVTADKIRRELDDLRYPVQNQKRLSARCFGNFEVYLDGMPMKFKYERTKELLAYLIDRRGALCTNGELIAVLFEDDENHDAYLRSLRKDLLDTLSAGDCGQVVVQQRGKLGILPDEIQCDYYDWCDGRYTQNPYHGEYMNQYSWGEYTNGALQWK